MKTRIIYTLFALYLADVSNVILFHLVNICTFKLKLNSNGQQHHHHDDYYQHDFSRQYQRTLPSFHRILMMASADMAVKCPPDRILYPCTCYHNEHIICTKSMTYSLGHVFRAISQSMLSSIHYHLSSSSQLPRPLFKELFLSNQYLDEMEDNLFNLVRFQRIILVNMNSLKRIKSNAFNGTQNDVQQFEIRGENKLGIKYMNQLFDALSSLINVREMYLELNHLEMIPSYAFRDIQMSSDSWIKRIRIERLQIISRSLTQISSYAFYELNSLRYIKIHSNVGLQRISAHAFDMAQPFSHPLLIDLQQNDLKISAFEMDAFQQVNRPVHLELTDNNLTSIPKQIFERFLNTDPKNSIQFQNNPLECNCNIFWLLKDRQIYMEQILNAVCHEEFIDLWSLDETAFRGCDHLINYTPKLILRNSATNLYQSISNNNNLLIFFSLLMILFL